jgi:Bacterial SH3 domain
MALQEKYQALIDAATAAGVTNIQAGETEGVYYINGDAPSGAVKDQLWAEYDKIDPGFASNDLMLNINVAGAVEGAKLKVTTESSNLNIRKGPGTDQAIIGKAGHHEVVTLISKTSDQWWLIRTADGEEGYANAAYLSHEG